jgi:AcrR family transcriptional regulator
MPRARKAAAVRSKPDEDVRARVLAAAVKLIGEQGLDALSMREVARAAGVSHQAPYHYFEDREAILAAIALEGFTILARRLENAALHAEGTASERLAELGRAYIHFACDQPALFRVMFRPDCVSPERFPELQSCGDRAFQTLLLSVKSCIDEGRPPEPSGTALVVLCWSTCHGLACLLLDGPLALKLPDVAKSREAIIDETMEAMKRLVDARTKPRGKSRR